MNSDLHSELFYYFLLIVHFYYCLKNSSRFLVNFGTVQIEVLRQFCLES